MHQLKNIKALQCSSTEHTAMDCCALCLQGAPQGTRAENSNRADSKGWLRRLFMHMRETPWGVLRREFVVLAAPYGREIWAEKCNFVV